MTTPRVFMDGWECWELRHRLHITVDNGWYRFIHGMVGWQAVTTYFDYTGHLVEIPWEPGPFPSEVCPACKIRVPAGDVKPIKLYRQEENRLCRWIAQECSNCRSDHPDIAEGDWPRGADGRWLKPEECVDTSTT